MRKSTLVGGLAGLAASMILVLPPPAVSAAQGDGGGGGGGGSGEVYSDLFVALRDEDGVPILSETFYEIGDVEGVDEEVTCIQPISYTEILGLEPVRNDADGRDVYLVPLVGEDSEAGSPVEADTACTPKNAEYASEVELERLNLVRTSDEVLWKKLAEVGTRLANADEITLDGAGRITTTTTTDDGVVVAAIDASPDQAAIYAATEGDPPAPTDDGDDGPTSVGKPGGLMDTGTIPHWTAGAVSPVIPLLGDPAEITQGSGGFDNWELAAAAVGTAAGKSVPITIDTIEYYNRTAANEGDVNNWTYAPTIPSVPNDPDGLFAGEPPPEDFVDYRDFSYTRAEVFTGCTTWLDVGTLTWKFDEVVNRVEFTDIVANASTSEVTNVAGFAQLADDVRSVISYLHENEVVVDPETGEGFFIDPVFMETCDEQADMVERLNADADLARLMVTITDAPEDGTSDTSATFEFEAVISSIWIQPGPFVCQLDDRVAEECASPKEYADLTVGEHTFTVYATDRGVGGLATVYNWTVVPPDLTVTITEKPEAQTYDTSATFAFEAVDEEGVVFFCQLDDQVAAEECASPKEFADLEVGDHTFTAYATDGDTDGPPTSYTWTVLSSDLKVRITSAPPAQTTVTSATFVFEAVEADMDFVCELDGLVMDPCTSGEMYPASVGDHTFTVYATDGDTDGLPVTYTWSVLAAGGSGGGGTLPPTPPPPPTPPTPPIIVPPGDQSMDVVSLAPVRLADTRPTPVAAGQVLEVAVAGRGGVPVGAEAVVANVTLVNAAGAGFATVFPCGTVPGASSVNYVAGGTVANEVIAKLSSTGSLCVYTSAAADVLVDVVGYV